MRVKQILSKASLEKEYNEIYDEAIKLLEGKNVCQFGDDGLCIRARNNILFTNINQREELCCYGCKSLCKGKGCTVRALTCKLWFCNHAWEAMPFELKVKIQELQKRANKFYQVRGTFDSWFYY